MKNIKTKVLSSLVIAAAMVITSCSPAVTTTTTPTSTDPTKTTTAAPGTTTPAPANDAVFAGGWPYATAPTGHFNMFIPNAIELKFYRELHQLPLATYVAKTDTYEPMLAKDWELSADKNSLLVNLKPDVLWQTGDAFTAKDVWTTFMMYRIVGNPVWKYVDSVTEKSATQLEFKLKEQTTMIYRYVLRKPIVDYKTYGEFADRAAALITAGKLEDSAEWKTLANDFTNFRPTMVNATGPYYLDPANVSQSHVELVKNDKSFLAGKVNFAQVRVYNGDVPDLTPLVLNTEVDYLTHQFPAASMATFKANGYKTIQLQGVDGIGLYINEAVQPMDKKGVRQALAYIIDRNRVGELALPGITRGAKYITGLGDLMTETWVDATKLINYTVDAAKATSLLEAEGLKKVNGVWTLADGKPFKLTLQAPTTWSDAATAASEIAQQLTAFGIATTFEGIDANSRQANITEGNFQLALSFWGTAQPHPMFAFETPLLVSNAKAAKGLSYPMKQDTANYGAIDMEQLIYDAAKGWDVAAQKVIVEKLVMTINDTVPYIPIYSKWSTNLSSNGVRTDWGTDETLYLNSAGDDNFAVLKILNGELKPLAK